MARCFKLSFCLEATRYVHGGASENIYQWYPAIRSRRPRPPKPQGGRSRFPPHHPPASTWRAMGSEMMKMRFNAAPKLYNNWRNNWVMNIIQYLTVKLKFVGWTKILKKNQRWDDDYILVTTVSFKELLVCIASIWGHRWDRQTFPFRPNRRSPSQQGCGVNPDMGDHHNEWRRWVFIYVYPFFFRCNIVQYEHYPMNIACTWHQQPRWTCFWDHQPALWKWPCTWCGSGRKKRWSIHRWKGYDVTQI